MKQSRVRVGLALALVAAVFSACQSSVHTAPIPTASAVAPTPLPTPTQTVTPTPSPSPPASPSATISTAGARGAFQAVSTYEEALLAGQFEKAWNLLGAGCRARWGTLAAFTNERTAFLGKAGTAYQEQISPTNTLSISDWIVGTAWASKIKVADAYLASVKWTAYLTNAKGTEIWIVNPIFTGWELYLANG